MFPCIHYWHLHRWNTKWIVFPWNEQLILIIIQVYCESIKFVFFSIFYMDFFSLLLRVLWHWHISTTLNQINRWNGRELKPNWVEHQRQMCPSHMFHLFNRNQFLITFHVLFIHKHTRALKFYYMRQNGKANRRPFLPP